jgi:DNA-binding response OmpR family regulator
MIKRLLLVEPDRIQAAVYQSALRHDFDVSWARTTQGAIASLDRKIFDVIVSETTLDHHNGVELLSEIRAYEDWLDLPIIFLSALPKERFPISVSKWQQFGVKAFLNKATTRPTLLRNTLVDIASETQ